MGKTDFITSLFLWLPLFLELCNPQTIVSNWDFTDITVAGANVYTDHNPTNNYSTMNIVRANNPRVFGNYNSQGSIYEEDRASDCSTRGNALINTGIISFTAYVYITDFTQTQYVYCKNRYTGGGAVTQAWCMGFTSANSIFVEANNNMMASNSMETFTTPFQLTLGWNLIGCYYDGNNFDPLTAVGTNYCFNVMHDGTTFQSAPIIHGTGNYTDEDIFITCVGGDKFNGGNSRSSLVGMTNQVQAYSDPITLGQMQTMVSYIEGVLY